MNEARRKEIVSKWEAAGAADREPREYAPGEEFVIEFDGKRWPTVVIAFDRGLVLHESVESKVTWGGARYVVAHARSTGCVARVGELDIAHRALREIADLGGWERPWREILGPDHARLGRALQAIRDRLISESTTPSPSRNSP